MLSYVASQKVRFYPVQTNILGCVVNAHHNKKKKIENMP